MAVPGWDIKILRDDQSEAEPNELGRIVAKLPMPPGCMSTLFKADQSKVSPCRAATAAATSELLAALPGLFNLMVLQSLLHTDP